MVMVGGVAAGVVEANVHVTDLEGKWRQQYPFDHVAQVRQFGSDRQRDSARSRHTPPFGCLCTLPIYNETKETRLEVMLIAKNAQKLDLAARSHLSELLDEALEETFPASDPIAIQVS